MLPYDMKRMDPESRRSPANAWDIAFSAPWPYRCVPLPAETELMELERQDLYGVSGTWLMVVSFVKSLEFHDFTARAFIEPGHEGYLSDSTPREPFPHVGRAGRMLMKLWVVCIEPPPERDDPEFPVVHFQGRMSSVYGANGPVRESNIEGKADVFS